MANVIQLQKDDIMAKIAGNFGGGVHHYGWAFYLIVSEDGGQHRIGACERQTWQGSDYVAKLPAPYGDGSGALAELAEDMLEDLGRLGEAEALADEADIDIVEAAGRLAHIEWECWQAEALDWYAEEWLAAINGEPNDLDSHQPWGTREIEPDEWEVIECPHAFEWA